MSPNFLALNSSLQKKNFIYNMYVNIIYNIDAYYINAFIN